MRVIFFILMVLILGCEGYEMTTTQNTKPTIVMFNPPEGANVEAPPSGILNGGFIDGDPSTPLYAKYFNYLRKENFRVADYLLADEHAIYVKTTSGNDSTGDGSSTLPYKTIAKAVSMIAPNAYTIIYLDEAGIYDIDMNIELKNKYVIIQKVSAKASTINFVSYTDSYTENNLYKFILYNSLLFINPNDITIDDPDDAGNNWNNTTLGYDAFAAAIVSAIGQNSVICGADVTFSNTAAAGGSPCLFHQLETSILSITYGGNIVTNSKGYVIGYYDADTAPMTIISNGTYTIDIATKKALNSASPVNQKLYTGLLGGSIGTFAIKLSAESLSTSSTLPIAEDESDANIKTAVDTLFDTVFVGQTNDVTITTSRDLSSNIKSIEIEIGGTMSGIDLPIGLYFVGANYEGIFQITQHAKFYGHNILTNF